MRSLRINLAAAAVLLLLAAAPGRAGDPEPWVQELFQWGEYDSLIRALEPWLAARSAGADGRDDSVALARANIFLGVAYNATDKPGLGDQAFARACRLDPSARLDRFYATPEISARFDSIATRERLTRLSAAAPAVPAAPAAAAAGGKEPAARKRGFGWKGWTLGLLTTAGLAAGGGMVYYALKDDRKTVTVEVGGD